MSDTIRNADYSAGDYEISSRIERARASLENRRNSLSEWSNIRDRELEENQINYIDGLLKWLEFGGELPFWISIEEEIAGKRFEAVL